MTSVRPPPPTPASGQVTQFGRPAVARSMFPGATRTRGLASPSRFGARMS